MKKPALLKHYHFAQGYGAKRPAILALACYLNLEWLRKLAIRKSKSSTV